MVKEPKNPLIEKAMKNMGIEADPEITDFNELIGGSVVDEVVETHEKGEKCEKSFGEFQEN